jgi:hypothetical protein
VSYRDPQAQVDLVLAAWQRGEVDPPTTIRALESILVGIETTMELKSRYWLVPQIKALIDRLATYGKEVAVSG